MDRDSRLFQPGGDDWSETEDSRRFARRSQMPASPSIGRPNATHTLAATVTLASSHQMEWSDDDGTRPPEEGLTVSPSIGPRFGNAGVWREAVANSYYAARADEDEISLRVAEADREAREAARWREECEKERRAIAERIKARHGAYPPKPAPPTPAEMDARRAQKKGEIMRLSKREEENKMLRARILPPHQYDGEFPEELRKHGRVLEHGGVYADTELWRRHEAEWEEFMETARGMSIIRKRQIPFPEAGGAALYRHLILRSIHEFNLSEEDAEKFAFRRCAMRWHPDKVMTAVGIRLLPEEYDEVGAKCVEVFREVQEEHKNRLRLRGTPPRGGD